MLSPAPSCALFTIVQTASEARYPVILPAAPSAEIHRVGSENHLIARIPSARNAGVEVVLHLCRNSRPGDCKFLAQEHCDAQEYRGARRRVGIVIEIFVPNANPSILHASTRRPHPSGCSAAGQGPNPRRTKGAPNFLEILRPCGYQEGVFGENIHRAIGNNIV